MNISSKDRKIFRDIARRIAEIADDPVMASRRKRWIEHNTLRSKYPMMLVFPEGGWKELIRPDSLQCSERDTRIMETRLRRAVYIFEHFHDDTVVDKTFFVEKVVEQSSWGLEPKWIFSEQSDGARHFDPVILEPSDLKKLKYPEVTYDEKASIQKLSEMQDLFGDILTVKLSGIKRISYHLMKQYTYLRGLEEMMVDMYSEPQMIHDAMAFFEEGHRRILKQYLDMNLLAFNNDNTYHNSGGNGYSDELPLKDADPNRVRPKDTWCSAESQEMAQVSPEHHAEFVLQYEKRLLEPFGLNGYGCCEDLTKKLDLVFTIPNIRRISISPWANVDVCAEKLRGKYIFSWKPNPAHLVGNFKSEDIRSYVRHTVEVTK
nr:hypothetical protein [Victivallales bacterium]